MAFSRLVAGICLELRIHKEFVGGTHRSSAFDKCISLNAQGRVSYNSCLILPTASVQLKAEEKYDLPLTLISSQQINLAIRGAIEPKPPLATC